MSGHAPSPYEHDNEPIRGLPGVPPEGETILWQGAPDWAAFAVHALHVRLVTLYFAAIVIAQPVFAGLAQPGDKAAMARATGEAVWTAVIGLIAIGLLCIFAMLVARTSVYTITNRRIVLRIGVAISKCVNLPFAVIQSASLRCHAGGVGDLAIELKPDAKASYLMLWPHARPWRLARPQPMLRAMPDAASVAAHLAQALTSAAAAPATPTPAPLRLARPPADAPVPPAPIPAPV